MNPNGFPRKQLLILTAVCAVVMVLAIIIGLIAKNGGGGTPSYVVEDETPVTRQ